MHAQPGPGELSVMKRSFAADLATSTASSSERSGMAVGVMTAKSAKSTNKSLLLPLPEPSFLGRYNSVTATSEVAMDRIALAMIRRAVLPMSMGRTHGCLSRAMR